MPMHPNHHHQRTFVDAIGNWKKFFPPTMVRYLPSTCWRTMSDGSSGTLGAEVEARLREVFEALHVSVDVQESGCGAKLEVGARSVVLCVVGVRRGAWCVVGGLVDMRSWTPQLRSLWRLVVAARMLCGLVGMGWRGCARLAGVGGWLHPLLADHCGVPKVRGGEPVRPPAQRERGLGGLPAPHPRHLGEGMDRGDVAEAHSGGSGGSSWRPLKRSCLSMRRTQECECVL